MRVRSRYPTSAAASYKANCGFIHFINYPKLVLAHSPEFRVPQSLSVPAPPGSTSSFTAARALLSYLQGGRELELMKMGPVPDALKDLLMLLGSNA